MRGAHCQITRTGGFEFLFDEVSGDSRLPELAGYQTHLSQDGGFRGLQMPLGYEDAGACAMPRSAGVDPVRRGLIWSLSAGCGRPLVGELAYLQARGLLVGGACP